MTQQPRVYVPLRALFLVANILIIGFIMYKGKAEIHLFRNVHGNYNIMCIASIHTDCKIKSRKRMVLLC